ncbi:glycosyltransferase [Methylonatrum kenyense]|uniref:glycosyltransferase n=1 Tax=Methylonatrum kenyense TaxID=455253 RepID=UPI0020C18629|nr:glycosyltransferase [Methylonatrum kenyense]MCK8516997.1 glycosyltransferase [Methylonatrum kenyense]
MSEPRITPSGKPMRIAVLSDHLRGLIGQGGGVDRCQWRLANEYARRGYLVDMVVFDKDGIEPSMIPANINLQFIPRSSASRTKFFIFTRLKGLRPLVARPILLPLKPSARVLHLPALADYLETHAPDLLISAGTYENVTSLLAKKAVNSKTRVLVSERNPLSEKLTKPKHAKKARWRHLPPLMAKLYPTADAVIAISETLKVDIANNIPSSDLPLCVIYNPVIDRNEDSLNAARVPDHPWLQSKEYPVIVSVGRLRQQKDYFSLLKAVATSSRTTPMRLIVVGDGPQKEKLEQRAADLGIADIVDFVGYKENARSYIAHSDVFALTSIYEGLPAVLIEALYFGVNIVATDCPGSSREILEDGRHGFLVPVKDPDAIAGGILSALSKRPNRDSLSARAASFSVERAAERYLRAAQFLK